ncbi:MAG: FAD-binding protein [Gemmobacter sp.]|nr:FAD-binding protein [Gemmobacter sp.]
MIRDLDAATRAHSGQELRMTPSTAATATIGGFIAGGSGGVGSVRWGALRDLGNIIRLRVVTMEAEPRILEFRGEELHRVSHAYGTNGIITEIELPLAPAYDWVEVFVGFARLCRGRAYGAGLAHAGRHPAEAGPASARRRSRMPISSASGPQVTAAAIRLLA